MSGSSETATQLPNPSETVEPFCEWLERKRTQAEPFPLQHNWSHRHARRLFARTKDVDRYFREHYPTFSTVLVTRTADENTEPLLEQTDSLSPSAYQQSRYRLLRRLSGGDYAGCVVRAPKYDLPNPSVTVRTHVHEIYYLPGHLSADDFELLSKKHMACVPGATDCHISVEQHDSYPTRTKRFGLDSVRGLTSAAPYELAENLPLMNVETDARDLQDDRCLEWCATLSAGTDGRHDTAGASYWSTLGNFGAYSDEMEDTFWRKAERDLRWTVQRFDNPTRTQRFVQSARVGTGPINAVRATDVTNSNND